jgi:hypothetical protein
MTFDDLLVRVGSEPNCTFERDVRVPSADLLREIGAAGGMRVDALMADPRHTLERRTFRYGHLLGPSVRANELARWVKAWSEHRLRSDLLSLLRRVNGIHLWADLDEGRAYQGLAPLEEWRIARQQMWGIDADPNLLDNRYLAISYHADGAAFVVLDTGSGRYFLMDSCGADESCPIGSSADELLDWLWEHRVAPDVPTVIRSCAQGKL